MWVSFDPKKRSICGLATVVGGRGALVGGASKSCKTLKAMCISRATVSAVSCLVVPAFICIDLLISRVLKINDDDDDEDLHNCCSPH